MTPARSINHHFTYHVAQASQVKHGSLVDRGANGGLAGSDVRILSRSSSVYSTPVLSCGPSPRLRTYFELQFLIEECRF